MLELYCLETASRLRQLAQFYGQAAQISVTPLTRNHYRELSLLCERRAYELEKDAMRDPTADVVHEAVAETLH